MKPESYLHTYKTYKEGMKRITTWLVQTARRCGADLSFLTSSQRPAENSGTNKSNRSNATSKAAPTTKHDVPHKQFTGLAKAIAASNDRPVKIPQHIVSLLNSVIFLRKEAYALFKKLSLRKNSQAAETANKGHLHFISVLEEGLAILQPPEATSGNADSLENMFEALTVEQTTAGDEIPEPANVEKGSSSATREEYDLETTDDDALFAVFTYFKDVMEVRNYLKSVWDDYRYGALNAMSAAVTTDTAFTLLRHRWKEVQQSLPGSPGYSAILEMFGGAGPALDEFMCMRTADILVQFTSILQPKVAPVLKPNHFGVYDPTVDREKLSIKEQHREDLIVMMELLSEFAKISRYNINVPAQDELTTALRQMIEANNVDRLPVYGFCAAQILLDIHHTLREDVRRPLNQLQFHGQRVVDTLDNYFRYFRNRTIATWHKQNDKALQQISDFAKTWALTDRIGSHVVKVAGNVRPREFQFLQSHPVLCGLLLFRLNMRLRDAGISLCNAWGSVMYPAHLYNAARQSAGLESEWEDIEYLLSVHSATRIFVGAPPTAPQDYFKRFVLALGGSASNFARNRRAGGPNLIVESKKGPRGLKTTSPVQDIFWSRYVEAGSIRLSTPNIVAMLAVTLKAEQFCRPSVDRDLFVKKMVVQKHFTTIQLLTAVREGVAGEELHLLFDYFSLHQRGYKLLRDLQTHLQADLANYFGPNFIENESELPYIVGYVFEVMARSNRLAENLRLEDGRSRILIKAAEVLARLIDNEDGKDCKKMAKLYTDTLQYAIHNKDELEA